MNTDNMSIAGETIDYGPCAFMDSYHPQTVYSSIDQMGRYAYGNQPDIAQWNLIRLAETLLPLLAENHDAAIMEAKEAIGAFAKSFETAYTAGLRRKLGLLDSRPDDISLAQDLLDRMADNGADFTLVFRRLYDAARTSGRCRCSHFVYGSGGLRQLGREMALSARARGRGDNRAAVRDARSQPCLHSAQSSGGGGDHHSPNRWGFFSFRETVVGDFCSLRGSASVRAIR